jgi:hypothetical protein
MLDVIQCPACHRQLRIRTELLGKHIRCPGCQTKFVAQRLEGAAVQPDGGAPTEVSHPESAPSVTGLSAMPTSKSPAPPDLLTPPAAPPLPSPARVFLTLGAVLGVALLIGLLIAWRVSAVVAAVAPVGPHK